MALLDLIQQLDSQPNATRRAIIEAHLDALGSSYQRQKYASGTNLVVELGPPGPRIGVGTHFDRVPQSAGANDNGSALAVGLDLVRRHREADSSLGVRVFFFDEEETGLKGSRAYVARSGTHGLTGLLNLEMVGQGDQFALWRYQYPPGFQRAQWARATSLPSGPWPRLLPAICCKPSKLPPGGRG